MRRNDFGFVCAELGPNAFWSYNYVSVFLLLGFCSFLMAVRFELESSGLMNMIVFYNIFL